MKYLLDTCTFIWFAADSPQLSATAKSVIEDPKNEGYLSVISLWEISMKAVKGKLAVKGTPAELAELAALEGLAVLPLSAAQVHYFHTLSPTHPDPFDRLLAAIALERPYHFISPEAALDSLGVTRVW